MHAEYAVYRNITTMKSSSIVIRPEGPRASNVEPVEIDKGFIVTYLVSSTSELYLDSPYDHSTGT